MGVAEGNPLAADNRKTLNNTAYTVANFRQSVSAKTITITAANGGENWEIGSAQNITWTSAGVTDIKITLWKNDVIVGTIVASTSAASGTYSWTVGTYIGGTAVLGTDYKIKIKEKGTAIADLSDAVFSITGVPSITVTAPNGGESLGNGRISNITWDSENLSSNVKITLWKNDIFVGNIAASLSASPGTFSWTVGNYDGGTASVGTGYTIKIKEKGTAVADFSNSSFSIEVPQLTLLSPNGGENWTLGSSQNITWNGDGLTNSNVKITLWENGLFVGTIVPLYNATSETYSWTVGEYIGGTASPGNNYTIKIKEKGTAVADISDGVFSIQI